MALKAVDALPVSSKPESKTRKVIEEFLESGFEVAEITDMTLGKGFGASINRTAKAEGIPVRAAKRGDSLYLSRYDWSENGQEAE